MLFFNVSHSYLFLSTGGNENYYLPYEWSIVRAENYNKYQTEK